MGLLSVPLRIARIAAAPLPDAGALTRGATALARGVTGAVSETLTGSATRRTSSRGNSHWIEVRGLGDEHGSAIADAVLAELADTPGVREAVLNRATSRVVVSVAPGGPSVEDLVGILDAVESSRAVQPGHELPATLPGDDLALAARLIGASVSATGLVVGTTASLLRVGGFSRVLSAPVTLAQHTPAVRRQIAGYLGPDATELAFALINTAVGVLTVSPSGLFTDAATRAMLAAEALNGRRMWDRHEAELTRQAFKSPDDRDQHPRVRAPIVRGNGERYADIAAAVGTGAGAVIGVASGDTDIAASAVLTSVAKPVRSVRESFACALSRGFAGHGSVVMHPHALRMFDVVDTVLIDPRALYTDELTVTRIDGVDPDARATAWEAARAALDDGLLTPGRHRLADIPGARMAGEALVSHLRDPLASAVVTEARRVGARIVSLDDDGLRSLGQGFDELLPGAQSPDTGLPAALALLHQRGATVALVTDVPQLATLDAAIVVGVWHDDAPPPWGADILVPDLAGVWRFLHAIPVARHAATRGVQLSVSGSVIGSIMLIPGVVGSGPGSLNLTALSALWTGYRLGAGIFGEPLPHPEPGHDWHALPVSEVARLLPRPKRERQVQERFSILSSLAPIRPLTNAATSAWQTVSDFVDAVRSDLDDPITPILATGAAATALLGSPLDAGLVFAVLLLNTAISAEQELHAERVLSGLLAVQEPLARRLIGDVGRGRQEKVTASRLRPGDLVLVGAGEVVPADGRVLIADSLEVDESALTGESLPVSKSIDPTPGAPLAERSGVLYAGTTVIAGHATMIVTTVGVHTQMNRATAMTARKARKVGLQAQLSHITGQALPWSIAGGGAVGLLSLLRRTPLKEAVAGGVAIAVAAVPEGLPLVATLAELAAARQLSDADVLIRNPRAVEAFARLDVVCFDKTGTLSLNQLQVKRVSSVVADGEDAVLTAAVRTVRPSKGKHFDHATDEAIRLAALAISQEPGGTDAQLPFQSDRPFAAGIVGTTLSVKGAPEAISAALDVDVDPLPPLIAEMTASGLRVIAVAERELTPAQAAAAITNQDTLIELCREGLTPLGAIGIADTLRPSARPLVEELQRRGIGVRVITGDHPVTARVIAGELGIDCTDDDVMTGTTWESLTTEGRIGAVTRFRVFARMAPEHKVQVVQALESADLVTAMVGDGANDAAAIRAATVGVGIVSTGSDPARTAADVLLLDGQIGALVAAIDEGHQLWRRVQAAVSMLVGHNLGEVSFALITSMVTGKPAMSARQILLINMLTDALPAAALAVSPQVGDGLADFDESALWQAIYTHGASTTVGATLSWLLARPSSTPPKAATVGLAGLVLTQLMQISSESHGKLVIMTSVGTFVVMAGVISTPGLSQLFGCEPLGPVGWAQAAAGAGAAMMVSKVAPEVIDRIADWTRRRIGSNPPGSGAVVVDDQNPGPDEQRVDFPDRRGQHTDTSRDEGVGPHRTGKFGHAGQANRSGDESQYPVPDWRDELLESTRSFVESHRDISKLVGEAERFAVQLPVIGRVAVPSPDQLAFYGALGLLALLEVIDWPVAVAVGVGHAVTTRQLEARVEETEAELGDIEAELVEAVHILTPASADAGRVVDEPNAPAARTAPRKTVARKTVARKTSATKAVTKKAVPKKAAAKKTPTRKVTGTEAPAKKAPAKKASAKKAPAKKTAPTKAAATKRVPAAKKAAAKKVVAKKTPAKKVVAKKTPAKSTADSRPTK